MAKGLTSRLLGRARREARRLRNRYVSLTANYPEELDVRKANKAVIDFIASLHDRPEIIAEIGVYRGFTTKKLAEMLGPDAEIHLYDYATVVDRVATELEAQGHTKVLRWGNSNLVLDSYNWSLARALERYEEPIYDYVLLDGAHTWVHDALAFLLIDRLVKPGGYVQFDDYDWTLAESKSMNPKAFPKTSKWFTNEQIQAKQVKMIFDLLVRRDENYVEGVPNQVFQKRSH